MSYPQYATSISTGKLQVNGPLTIYSDTSGNGSTTASINAVQVETTYLYANTVNATEFFYNTASIDVSGNLTVQGNTVLNNLEVQGNVVFDASATLQSLNINNATINTLTVTGSETVGGSLAVTGAVSAASVSSTGAVSAGSVVSTGAVTAASAAVTGAVSAASAAVTGAVTAGSVVSTGAVSAASVSSTGAVTAASAAVTGAVNAASAAITGAVTAASAAITGAVTSASVTATGAVTATSLATTAGFVTDTFGNVYVPGSETVQGALNVTGTVALLSNTYVGGNAAIVGNEYIGGNAYINNGLTVGDSSNGFGVSLNVVGNNMVLSQIRNTSDLSGNITTVVKEGNLLIDGAINVSGTTIDNSGNLVVLGNESVSGSLSAGSLSTTGAISGASVAVTGAVSGRSLNVSGTTIDISGNLIVAGSTTVESLLANGTASFGESVNVTENEAVQGGFYTDGGAYVNNNFVVGDGSEGDGVTMHTTGTTLDIFGVTQDSSATAFPITVDVQGSLGVSDPSGNTTTFSTVLDTSDNVTTLGLTLPSSSTLLTGTGNATTKVLPVVINGTVYYLNLYSTII